MLMDPPGHWLAGDSRLAGLSHQPGNESVERPVILDFVFTVETTPVADGSRISGVRGFRI
jgi:hypothetical protein